MNCVGVTYFSPLCGTTIILSAHRTVARKRTRVLQFKNNVNCDTKLLIDDAK